MKRNEYWNDVASKGAVLGALMLASSIFEQSSLLSSSLSLLMIMVLERILAAVVFVWLLYRFAKRAAVRFGDDTLGFSYSQGLMYVWCVSLFAGVIVGLGGYLYLHYGVGYEEYTERLVDNMHEILYNSGALTSDLRKTYDTMLSTLAERPEPSVLSNVLSSVAGYGFWGVLVGLFVAAGVKREPRLFDNDENNRPNDEL